LRKALLDAVEDMLRTRVAVLQRIAQELEVLVKDHENRLRKLERIAMYGAGVIGVVSIGLHFMEHLGGR
jgi:hypothetical protein